ncbi:MAG: C40 family peptidase [Bacillota bacterium]
MQYKILLMLASDKRVQHFILSLVIGVVMVFVLPIFVMFSMETHEVNVKQLLIQSAFHGVVYPDVPDEFVDPLEKIIDEFEKIDDAIAGTTGLDDIKIKSFFYVLYLGESDTFADDFYLTFVEVFTHDDSDEGKISDTMYGLVEGVISDTITADERVAIAEVYAFMKFGYVSSGGYVDEMSSESFRILMAEATKYIGYPYVWGGSTPSTSFDCSGFVCWSYTQSGVYNLPRTTAQYIYNQCVPIHKDDVQQGDLVFFTGTYSTSNPVTHIGIYVGENTMLHCGDPIGYADLDNAYWSRHFYGFGRLE